MEEELVFLYKKKKMYINFVILMLAVVIVAASFISVQNGNWATIAIFVLMIFLIVFIVVNRVAKLKQMDYFIRCTKDGIYTKEAFEFCEWKKIKAIELKRYMGYQTLFFWIDSPDLKAKFKPIIRAKKRYYCLPLADCKGKPQEILEKITAFTNF